MVVALVVWMGASLWWSHQQVESLEGGSYAGPCRLVTDVFDGRWGDWAIGELAHGVVLVNLDDETGVGRGDSFAVQGSVSGGPGEAAGHRYEAILDIRSVDAVEKSGFLPHRFGQAIRDRVTSQLSPMRDGRALLSGFLIGDTSGIDPIDVEAMRRSGLAHFVAVSGSNVALFLALLFVCAGPLALGPKRRAVVGLLALPLYAAATRFEPSVMRASVMAAIALGGRLFDFVLEAWQLLSLAVVVLLLFDPGLSANLGFQLSVAATTGVLVGARWPAQGLVRRALYITMGAQIAVAPLLVAGFGAVPLFSPVVNLVAAPIVSAATLSGALGVAGLDFLLIPATWLADVVLALARGAAGWPQIGMIHLVLGLAAFIIHRRWAGLRPHMVVLAAALALWLTVFAGAHLEPGMVAVLDVGQGDAILLSGGDGQYALVDGGPEPALLVRKLREYGVRRLDLVVLTHVHADHAMGLIGAVSEFPISEMWLDIEPHSTSASSQLIALLGTRGVPMREPVRGESRLLGSLRLSVLGPVRRYASPNDQSIVLMLEGPSRRMLLSGDIETHAQGDLRRVHAEVLKVPHQGAATSDADWLASVGADTAVISVGPNQFGHPVDWVIETLETSGASVVRTDEVGDVVIDLS